MKGVAKHVARLLLGDYSIYRIFRFEPSIDMTPGEGEGGTCVVEVDRQAIESSDLPLMREQAWYAGEGAFAYAFVEADRIRGLCFYWHGDRYLQRNFWPLRDGEAKLVQVVTAPDSRGRGVAATLIRVSSQSMRRKGFERLYARIWHSNVPSLKAFSRAGWSQIATVIEVHFLQRRSAWRWVLGRGKGADHVPPGGGGKSSGR